MQKAIIEVKDVPEWAIIQPYPFWICILKDGELVFHGAYRRRERAEQAIAEGDYNNPHNVPIIVERMNNNDGGRR